jgi:hypothetical protein
MAVEALVDSEEMLNRYYTAEDLELPTPQGSINPYETIPTYRSFADELDRAQQLERSRLMSSNMCLEEASLNRSLHYKQITDILSRNKSL